MLQSLKMYPMIFDMFLRLYIKSPHINLRTDHHPQINSISVHSHSLVLPPLTAYLLPSSLLDLGNHSFPFIPNIFIVCIL